MAIGLDGQKLAEVSDARRLDIDSLISSIKRHTVAELKRSITSSIAFHDDAAVRQRAASRGARAPVTSGTLRWMLDASPRFVLVHSPLLGPSAWEWVARELDEHGRMAVVPSLREVVVRPEPWWRDACEVVAASAHGAASVMLVGHSGAGALLPAIAESIAVDVTGIVFIDAFLPPPSGTAPLVPPTYIDELDALATDGILPPWSSWFGEELMRELVPDAARRALVERDLPRLPLSSLRTALPVPSGWDRRPCGYLLLSAEPYAPSAADARARRWPVAEIEGGKHLDPVRRPAAVAAALLDLEHAMAGHA